MRLHRVISGLFLIPCWSLTAYYQPQPQTSEPQQNEYNNSQNPAPQQPNKNQQQAVEEEDEIADRRSNLYEYNLYDRQQNRIDQQQRNAELENNQQQQYYYQQSSGANDSGTQYNRTKTKRPQYFNPIDD